MTVAPDRLKIAIRKIQDDPYDVEAWNLIVKDATSKKIDDGRATFERLVSYFPTSGRFWKLYIEAEMRYRNYERVEKLFQRCLMKILNIDLWKTYLLYVKETKSSLPSYKEKMAQAYDFALDKMGMDIASFSVWNDYVNFLKSVEAAGSYAENQKITAIRKIYQKGIVNPMINIESFWKDYVSFEQGINPILAEKITSERSRDYMNARRVSKEYEACTRGLNKSLPCVPPTGNQEEMKQIELWRKYISWERSNPLRVEDQALIAKRVMFAYEQSLLCLGHHPDIWYEAAQFLQESSRVLAEKGDVDSSKMFLDQASAFYERATTGVLQKCMLLHFAHADFEEQQMRTEKVHQIYLKYLEIEDIDPTLCYIQYLKFCRRAEGIKAARACFKKAREDERSTYHVFVAAALMEYYCTKDKNIAVKIFELGLRKFPENEEYVLAYIDFLSHLNEDNNTRVLFERVLTSGSLSTEKSAEIWTKFLEFESQIGDLASIIKVEKRRGLILEQLQESSSSSLPQSETAQLIDRYRFMSLFPASGDELRALGYVDFLSKPGGGADSNGGGTITQATPVVNGVASAESDAAIRPDVSQMIPFKPKLQWVPGEHTQPGGSFPLPPAASDLCQNLPPPHSFTGPFVIVDKLIERMNMLQMPESFTVPPSTGNNGHNPKLFDLAKSIHWFVDPSDGSKGGKRKGGEDSDDDMDSNAAPANDIYRQRQQKRMK